MKNMTLKNIAAACGGTYIGDPALADSCIQGAVTDSRHVEPGFLYIPIRGERVDGHSFIPAAFKAGALAVLTEEKPESKVAGALLDNKSDSRAVAAQSAAIQYSSEVAVQLDGKSKNPAATISAEKPESIAGPHILVNSCPQALKDIAEFYRKQLDIKIVGITGSVGKTSTKEMIAGVLSQKYNVLKTEGNFNNEIGLPLTILRIQQEHQAAVVEMGISDFGEMHRLAKIARPDICVMTNIGECHLENLGDRDGVLRAKSEIFDFLKPDGAIILNGNDDKLSTIGTVKGVKPVRYYVCEGEAGTAADGPEDINEVGGKDRTAAGDQESENEAGVKYPSAPQAVNRSMPCKNQEEKISGPVWVTEGQTKNEYLVFADNIENKGLSGMEFDLHINGRSMRVNEPIPGQHNVLNACAAACAGKLLSLTDEEICAGIEQAKTIAGRTNLIKCGDVTLIDDCYNANPVSMKASLDVLSLAGGRKIAVLGDMGELGENELELHAQVGEYAAGKGIDILFAAGELSREMTAAASAGCRAEHFNTKEELIKALLAQIRAGDTVLVKASHFMGYSQIVDKVKELITLKGNAL